MDKKRAFTLAEVLITLGIIGVVAALTLPALINNYKKQETVARLKKFYSAMSQAILLSENDNGPSKEWTKAYYADLDDDSNKSQTLDYFNTFIKPYIKYTSINENPTLEDDITLQVYLADGSYFGMKNGACMDINYDTNGIKPPNKAGVDTFKFIICPEEKYEGECGPNKNFCPYCSDWACNTREKALNTCKKNGLTCAKVLMMDGWEFKKDYPHRL